MKAGPESVLTMNCRQRNSLSSVLTITLSDRPRCLIPCLIMASLYLALLVEEEEKCSTRSLLWVTVMLMLPAGPEVLMQKLGCSELMMN